MKLLKFFVFFLMMQLFGLLDAASISGIGQYGKHHKTEQSINKRDDPEYVTVDELNKVVNQLNQSIITNAQGINVQGAILNQLSVQEADLATNQSKADTRISAIESQQTEERQPIPLFYGRFDEIVRYSNGELYKFNDIVTQTGSGKYNTDDGKYTCGETGYYLVAVMLYGGSLRSKGNTMVYGDLYLDTVKITTLKAVNDMYTKDDQADDLQASSAVIVQCNKDQTLYVKGYAQGGTEPRTDRGDFAVMLFKK